MSGAGTNWSPSSAEQRLLWWLDLIWLKCVVGGGGLVWELVIDKARNPLVLLVCGMLAMSTNAFQFLKRLLATARAEQADLEALLESERRSRDERSK